MELAHVLIILLCDFTIMLVSFLYFYFLIEFSKQRTWPKRSVSCFFKQIINYLFEFQTYKKY